MRTNLYPSQYSRLPPRFVRENEANAVSAVEEPRPRSCVPTWRRLGQCTGRPRRQTPTKGKLQQRERKKTKTKSPESSSPPRSPIVSGGVVARRNMSPHKTMPKNADLRYKKCSTISGSRCNPLPGTGNDVGKPAAGGDRPITRLAGCSHTRTHPRPNYADAKLYCPQPGFAQNDPL